MIDGAFTGAITGAITGALNPTACFVAGTVVLTVSGHTAIEEIEVGDYVWASDPETGETAPKRVVQTFVNQTDELVHLTINGETITTTPTHPFYKAKQGWFRADSLRAGDILVTVNGEFVILEQVQHELLEAPINVYNFEVEDFHTYFVGEDDGVLVHNSCNHGKEWNAEKRRYWREQATKYQNIVGEVEAPSGTYFINEKNLKRMADGKAPIGTDRFSVQLHHNKGIKNDFYDYREITRTDHFKEFRKLHSWLFGG